MSFYLNECSLVGQFDSIDVFSEKELVEIVRCINLIKSSDKKVFYKTSDFYKRPITKDLCVTDLMKSLAPDEMVRIQLLFANEIYESPFWDKEEYMQNVEANYMWGDVDVTATSMAEAGEASGTLLSFSLEGLVDRRVEIAKTYRGIEDKFSVHSVHTEKYLSDKYGDVLGVTRDNQLKVRYRGTRIDCSQIEMKYGADTISEEAFEGLKSTLDKFAAHESFESIALDDGLEYKKYTPEQKGKDRFNSAKYKGKTIMKFRFSQLWRGYGYRKGDKFFLLRLEVDHSISDFG